MKKKGKIDRKCEACNNIHDGSYGSGRFCKQSCSRSFSTREKREAINKKVSISLLGRKNGIRKNGIRKKREESGEDARTYIDKICPTCNKQFRETLACKHQTSCSRICATRWKYNPINPGYETNISKSRNSGIKSAQAQKETRRSKNEILFANLCQDRFEDVKTNEGIFNGWDADVIIPHLKIAVLWNGAWHYKEISKKNTLKQIQNRDRIKLLEIEKAGYSPYIIKDMGKYNEEFVKEKWLEFLEYINTRGVVRLD
jgi:hypothetical protein